MCQLSLSSARAHDRRELHTGGSIIANESKSATAVGQLRPSREGLISRECASLAVHLLLRVKFNVRVSIVNYVFSDPVSVVRKCANIEPFVESILWNQRIKT